ncbi:MAG: zf-HC2 domain-containing protein [Candidatus Latescibacteria bacterium]|nr:zf-HC2 domain-containing protein [Candidatus Latescibacterota bacterium]
MHEALSGTLVDEQRAVLDRHLTHCRACQTDYTVLRAVVQAVADAPPLQPSPAFTIKVLDRLPAPVLVFGRVPVRVLWAIVGVLGSLTGTVAWVYRTAIIRGFQGVPEMTAGTKAMAAPFQFVVNTLRASLEGLRYRFPVLPEPQRLEPIVSVLIAVGVAFVILKMIDGFQTAEFESAPDESYS